MKIAIFTNNYLPNPFGVSSSIESFRKKFEEMGHEIFIFAPKTKGYIDENPRVFRYPSLDVNYKISFPLAIPYSCRINKILKDLEIDIIHSQHPNLLGGAARSWAKKKNVPLIFTWHTLYDQYAHFAPPFIPRKLATWWVVKNAVKYANRADFVVTPTESVKRIIESWGVSNKKIVSIPTGIDEKIFSKADRQGTRRKYGISDEKIVLEIVSRFTEEKNVEFVFRSAAKVLKERVNAIFLVKGSGHLLSKMKELAIGENIVEKVIFTDESEPKENVFAAGDLFIYASKSETQGMVITEALVSGLPVVAVDAPGVSDQVLDGASGVLVKEDEREFGGAVKRLIDDSEMRKRFSENAKKTALENYTSEICAKKMLSIYEKALENKKPSLGVLEDANF